MSGHTHCDGGIRGIREGKEEASWGIIDLSCLATLPKQQPSPSLVCLFSSLLMVDERKKRNEVSKNKMPPLNHLGGSCVRTVMGNALIIPKVTALPEPPSFLSILPLSPSITQCLSQIHSSPWSEHSCSIPSSLNPSAKACSPCVSVDPGLRGAERRLQE